MVKINRIYTRTGDDGETHLVGGLRVAKDSLRVDAFGDVDELNALIGLVRTHVEKAGWKEAGEMLAIIQNELFDAGSELATPAGQPCAGMITIQPSQSSRLEGWIDQLTAGLPELRSFVLPGGTEINSILHVARTVCRRAERKIVKLVREENASKQVLVYFNRLSDLLFAMARAESRRSGCSEYLWAPGKTGS